MGTKNFGLLCDCEDPQDKDDWRLNQGGNPLAQIQREMAVKTICVGLFCLYVRVHSLSVDAEEKKQQLQKVQSDLAAECEKHRQAAETVKRLSRKLLLMSKVRISTCELSFSSITVSTQRTDLSRSVCNVLSTLYCRYSTLIHVQLHTA